MKNLKRKLLLLSAAFSTAILAGSAHAASVLPVDFDLADVSADIVTVGSALIALAATALGLRWVKATFF
jgi:hypothetical protein